MAAPIAGKPAEPVAQVVEQPAAPAAAPAAAQPAARDAYVAPKECSGLALEANQVACNGIFGQYSNAVTAKQVADDQAKQLRADLENAKSALNRARSEGEKDLSERFNTLTAFDSNEINPWSWGRDHTQEKTLAQIMGWKKSYNAKNNGNRALTDDEQRSFRLQTLTERLPVLRDSTTWFFAMNKPQRLLLIADIEKWLVDHKTLDARLKKLQEKVDQLELTGAAATRKLQSLNDQLGTMRQSLNKALEAEKPAAPVAVTAPAAEKPEASATDPKAAEAKPVTPAESAPVAVTAPAAEKPEASATDPKAAEAKPVTPAESAPVAVTAPAAEKPEASATDPKAAEAKPVTPAESAPVAVTAPAAEKPEASATDPKAAEAKPVTPAESAPVVVTAPVAGKPAERKSEVKAGAPAAKPADAAKPASKRSHGGRRTS